MTLVEPLIANEEPANEVVDKNINVNEGIADDVASNSAGTEVDEYDDDIDAFDPEVHDVYEAESTYRALVAGDDVGAVDVVGAPVNPENEAPGGVEPMHIDPASVIHLLVYFPFLIAASVFSFCPLNPITFSMFDSLGYSRVF